MRKDLVEAAEWADVALDFEGLSVLDGQDMGVIARRSSNSWTLRTTGREGHSSGIFSPGAGNGAIYEMARIISRFREELPEQHLTFNVGLIAGGTTATLAEDRLSAAASGKTNIIPPVAVARGDLRTISLEQTDRVVAKMRAIVADNMPGTDAFVGLTSYSAYLWHQPLFAFARIASLSPPSPGTMIGLTILTFVLAGLSWRYVERPFRDPAFPFRRFVALVGVPAGLLAALGLVLHFNAGFPRWTFPNIDTRADVHIGYNERIRTNWSGPFPDNGLANVLVIGNSYGRDVANVLLESSALDGKNLRYVLEEGACPLPQTDEARAALAHADVLVVAVSGRGAHCIEAANSWLQHASPVPFIVFGDKYFGESINPFARVPMERRSRAFADAGAGSAADNDRVAAALPPGKFVDLMRALGPDGRRLRFFDDAGNPISLDRLHLTRYGAIFVARRLERAGSPALRLVADARPSAR